MYDINREIGIEQSLEAQGYNAVQGKAKQERRICPFCDSPYGVSTTSYLFNWQEVEYTAPVRHCRDCEESWTDYEYEDCQIAAIKVAGYQVDAMHQPRADTED
jgi:hypothetical protein